MKPQLPTVAASPSTHERPPHPMCSQWIGTELRWCRSVDDARRWVQGYRCGSHAPGAVHSTTAPPERKE